MAKKYVHIGINWIGPPKTEEIHQLVMAPNAAEDWIKYGGNSWIVYSQYDQNAWAEYLRPHIRTADTLLIYEIVNLHQSAGWAPKWLWDWINRPRF